MLCKKISLSLNPLCNKQIQTQNSIIWCILFYWWYAMHSILWIVYYGKLFLYSIGIFSRIHCRQNKLVWKHIKKGLDIYICNYDFSLDFEDILSLLSLYQIEGLNQVRIWANQSFHMPCQIQLRLGEIFVNSFHCELLVRV